MKYTTFRLSMAAAVCCILSLASSPVSAGWGSYGGGSYGSYGSYYGGSSGGSSGSYVSSYGSSGGSSGSYVSSYGSSGGSSGSYISSYGSSGSYVGHGSSGGAHHGPGPIRRLFAHLHDHVHSRHAHRASYGSSGSYVGYGSSGYGSSGGALYYSGYGSSGGSYYGGSSGGSSGGAVSYGSTGAGYGSSGGVVTSGYLGVSNNQPSTAASLVSNSSVTDDAVYINVTVPAAAKVFVNNAPTTSTGSVRQFVSRGLIPGKTYKFEIRAEVVGVDGQVAQETKTVMATAGQRDNVMFALSGSQAALETTVTLHVPEGADVILAGNKTQATGATRTFRTAQLKAGERWDDYVVEVRMGDKVKRESLRLVAGDDIQLNFNFDETADRIASR